MKIQSILPLLLAGALLALCFLLWRGSNAEPVEPLSGQQGGGIVEALPGAGLAGSNQQEETSDRSHGTHQTSADSTDAPAGAPRAVSPGPNTVSSAASPDARFKRLPDGRSEYRESVAIAQRLAEPTGEAALDLEAVESLFGAYLWAFKELPEGGENHEVVAGLTGDNPKRVIFIPPDHPRLDARGNLLDRWGTPYFFHKQSESELEIVSAGPDRRLWSGDDLKLTRESSL